MKSCGALSQSGAKKITFLPKPDGQTDISIYRVASLLKKPRLSYLLKFSQSRHQQNQKDSKPSGPRRIQQIYFAPRYLKQLPYVYLGIKTNKDNYSIFSAVTKFCEFSMKHYCI